VPEHALVLDAGAREKLEAWREGYNEVTPLGAIGNKLPVALMNCDQAGSPPSQ
jgi:putative transposase